MRQVGDESILPSVVAFWDQTEHGCLFQEGGKGPNMRPLASSLPIYSEITAGRSVVECMLRVGERPSENQPGSLFGGPDKYTAHMPCQGVQPETLPSCLGGEELTPARALG